jgi:hypothetical protein
VISNNRKSLVPVPVCLEDAKVEMQRIAQTMDKASIKPSIYKGEKTVNYKKKYEVRDALKVIYYNKCAYCESIEHKPEVEHYRPTKKVTGITHNGYYWLCYEWTNLIPSCRYCNTEGGKGNYFPIIGARVTTPTFDAHNNLDFDTCKAENSPLIDEQPYLFHPEVDVDIDTNFEFFKNGEIQGVDILGRGNETIRICNLNRANLLEKRQRIIDDYFYTISEYLDDYFKSIISLEQFQHFLIRAFSKIGINSDTTKPFSTVSKYIQNNFDIIIVPLFPTPKQRLIIQNAYRQFQNKTLISI